MSSDVAVCPHCGKHRDPAATAGGGGLAKVKMSPEELRALATLTAPDTDRGIVATLLVPHPDTTGAARTLEIVLTIATLPLVLSGLALVGLRRLVNKSNPIGEGGAVVLMALVGGVSLAFSLADLGFATAAGVTAGEIALLAVRARIRYRASRESKLLEVGK
jgi:hypothetical protein|nr:hypothetical protein [Kofleriaceae bacterium]